MEYRRASAILRGEGREREEAEEMMRRWLTALMWSGAVSLPLFGAEPADDALTALRKTVDPVVVLLKDAALDRDARFRRIEEIVTPAFDFPLMAKLVVGGTNWTRFAPPQQSEFTTLFVDFLKKTYMEKIDQVSFDRVEYRDAVAAGKDRAEVVLDVVSRGEKVSLIYKMHCRAGPWLIYDVGIKGVSVVTAYRADYQELLETNTPEEVIAMLRKKLGASELPGNVGGSASTMPGK